MIKKELDGTFTPFWTVISIDKSAKIGVGY